MSWHRAIICTGSCNLTYCSDMPLEPGDKVAAETKYGPVLGRVVSIEEEVFCNPFEPNDEGYNAKKRILENATKKIYEKKAVVMFGCKTVEVKHISSNRRGIFYTDMALNNGDIVVYESEYDNGIVAYEPEYYNGQLAMHVGVVVDNGPDVLTAKNYIVDIVHTDMHEERKKRTKEAAKLRMKLEAKKKQLQDMELLRLIAANDPDTKALLDEYTKLIGLPTEV